MDYFPSHSSARSVGQRLIDVLAASDAVRASVAYAKALGTAVNVAVVDVSGVLVAFLRMPGAPLHSIDIAIDKAYTAASFGLATSQWHGALQEHSDAVREGIVRRARFIAFGGGLPILEQGLRIGGIGVSGGSEEQDEAIAQAGLKAIGLASSQT
jgi:uncharacterized protein GlcG (DUF336 family)